MVAGAGWLRSSQLASGAAAGPEALGRHVRQGQRGMGRWRLGLRRWVFRTGSRLHAMIGLGAATSGSRSARDKALLDAYSA
jgi:hypothetical protein